MGFELGGVWVWDRVVLFEMLFYCFAVRQPYCFKRANCKTSNNNNASCKPIVKHHKYIMLQASTLYSSDSFVKRMTRSNLSQVLTLTTFTINENIIRLSIKPDKHQNTKYQTPHLTTTTNSLCTIRLEHYKCSVLCK